jgi:hypothetical protein
MAGIPLASFSPETDEAWFASGHGQWVKHLLPITWRWLSIETGLSFVDIRQ